MQRSGIAACAWLGVLTFAAWGVDDNKAKLFKTFYLDGDAVTYVLTMRADRTFDLYGPNGQHVSGTIRADDEHVTLTAGQTKRFFHYEHKGHDMKLWRREDDRPVKGSLMGELPPTSDFETQILYLCEANWKKKGRPEFKPPPKAPAQEPATTVQEPVVRSQTPAAGVPPAQPPATKPQGSFADLAGTYFLDGKTKDCLVLTADGCFGYVTGDGTVQNGTLLRTDDELTFIGPEHKRYFTARPVAGGVELTRRPADVIKPSDILGRMPPQERQPALWLKRVEAPAATPKKDNPPEPIAGPPLPPAPPPEPAKVAKVTPPQPAAVPVKSVEALVGTFVHKPNPFLSETLVVKADGSFSYKDSNGAAAEGKVTFEGEVMTLTSGEVIRRFTAALDGGGLSLACAKDDAPKFRNDLATMSPTVLKTARYEKK
ncbi:MAG: hypothetical protein NTW87_28540 [Planctomycetota bacterium]|nr:hypothetical protein [Planctomycetota bacterium]